MEDIVIEPTQRREQKRRVCLRCQDKFQSEWAGDRICPRCKQSSAWRAGQPLVTGNTRSGNGRTGSKSRG